MKREIIELNSSFLLSIITFQSENLWNKTFLAQIKIGMKFILIIVLAIDFHEGTRTIRFRASYFALAFFFDLKEH